MSTIDRYVAGAFARNFLLLMGVLLGLYVLVDLMVNIDEFTEAPNASVGSVVYEIADYYVYNLPLYFSQVGGPALAIAAAFTVAVMLGKNELTALVAAGMPLQRLLVPIVCVAVVALGAWIANNELVLPVLAPRIAREHKDISGARTAAIYCARDRHNVILTAREFGSKAGVLNRVFLIEPDADRRPETLIRADSATWDPQRRVWRLERGSRLRVLGAFAEEGLGESFRWEPLDEYPFGLAPQDLLLQQSAQWTELMSIAQMNAIVRARGLPNIPAIIKARDVRVVRPVMIFVLLALAVSFFLTRAPTNVLAAGGWALLWCAVCFAFTFMMHAMRPGPYSLLTAATPAIVFGPLAVLRLANLKT